MRARSAGRRMGHGRVRVRVHLRVYVHPSLMPDR